MKSQAFLVVLSLSLSLSIALLCAFAIRQVDLQYNQRPDSTTIHSIAPVRDREGLHYTNPAEIEQPAATKNRASTKLHIDQ